MRSLELRKERRTLFITLPTGQPLAEFLGTDEQAAELVAKFNHHVALFKALRRCLAVLETNSCPTVAGDQARALLNEIQSEFL